MGSFSRLPVPFLVFLAYRTASADDVGGVLESLREKAKSSAGEMSYEEVYEELLWREVLPVAKEYDALGEALDEAVSRVDYCADIVSNQVKQKCEKNAAKKEEFQTAMNQHVAALANRDRIAARHDSLKVKLLILCFELMRIEKEDRLSEAVSPPFQAQLQERVPVSALRSFTTP